MKFENKTPDQLRDLLQRSAADEQDELARVWALTGDEPMGKRDVDIEAAVQQFERRLKGGRADRPAIRRSRSVFTGWKVFASFVVLALVGSWLSLQPVEQTAPVGSMTTVALPDGSQVTLNGGSSLSYNGKLWLGDRKVQLVGEGFFDIKPANQPFIVETHNAAVRVLGTTFNVQAWPGEVEQTSLAVTEGSVNFFSIESSDQGVVVTEGEASHVVGNAAPLPAFPANVALNALWMEGGFASIDRPLGELFNLLSFRFDIELTIAPDVTLDDTLTWIQPVLASPGEAFSDVCKIANCLYQQQGKMHLITRAEAQ